MSLKMNVSSLPSRLGSLFARNGADTSEQNGLPAGLEEPEATTSQRTIGAAGGGASKPSVAPSDMRTARRRRYSRQEKLRILRLVDACTERGQVGAILRREGIYYSTLRDFQKQRANGGLEAIETAHPNNVADPHMSEQARIKELEAQNRTLTRQLVQAELVIDVQKKVCQLFGLALSGTETALPTREASGT
jgi:transposase